MYRGLLILILVINQNLEYCLSEAQIQNPVVSCSDNKRKLLCLPIDYSKFDLPYRNEYNVIDIGENEFTP